MLDERDGAKNPKQKMLYKTFPGKSAFYWDGRLMSSHDLGGFWFSFGTTLVIEGLFHGVSAPYLWHEVSPVIPLVTGYLGFVTLVMLFRTTFTDPGVIPRTNSMEGEHMLEREGGSAPRVRDVLIGTTPHSLKYCQTCQIYRPPRAVHCSVCDNCVDGFDHHCPWVGNCVGKRNYRFFTLFVASITGSCVLVFAGSALHIGHLIHDNNESFGSAIKKVPTVAIVMVVTFMAFWSVGGLLCFHANLISDGVTTNEYIKRTYRSRRENPFYRGSCVKNGTEQCCGPRRPSALKLRERYSDPYFTEADSDLSRSMRPVQRHRYDDRVGGPDVSTTASDLDPHPVNRPNATATTVTLL